MWADVPSLMTVVPLLCAGSILGKILDIMRVWLDVARGPGVGDVSCKARGGA